MLGLQNGPLMDLQKPFYIISKESMSLPHKVKMQYLHLKLHANYFLVSCYVEDSSADDLG